MVSVASVAAPPWPMLASVQTGSGAAGQIACGCRRRSRPAASMSSSRSAVFPGGLSASSPLPLPERLERPSFSRLNQMDSRSHAIPSAPGGATGTRISKQPGSVRDDEPRAKRSQRSASAAIWRKCANIQFMGRDSAMYAGAQTFRCVRDSLLR